MTYRKREYKDYDFIKVRNFLKNTVSTTSSNWYIDRWNFCRYFGQIRKEIASIWPGTVGLWVDQDDNIVAIVNSEGDNKGEVFFQLKEIPYTSDFLEELVNFAETNLPCREDDKNHLHLVVNNSHRDQIESILKKRKYTAEDSFETDCAMDLTREFEVRIPADFAIRNASIMTPERIGLAHWRAFNNSDSNIPGLLKDRIRAFKGLKQAPDYRTDLDLSIVDQHNEIASFAIVWYDELNQIGILEPVGTIPKYRRMGLGKAVIYEGINRIMKLGAKKIHVGSNQAFYKSIGFSAESTSRIWHKSF